MIAPCKHVAIRHGAAITTSSKILAAIVLVGVSVPSCNSKQDRRAVVNFWAMGGEGERIAPLVAQFELAHPDIRVRVQQIPWSAAHEKLLTAFAGDALPDVCQLGNTWIAEFDALGALENLAPRVAASPVVDPDDFFEGVWRGNVVEDRLVGLPWYVDTRLLFYRTDLLSAAGHDEPPATWDDWMRVMRDVKAMHDSAASADKVNGLNASQPRTDAAQHDRYAILLPTNEFEPPIILGMQTGAQMLRNNGCLGSFSSAAFRRAFRFYVNIFEEGLAPKTPNTRISNVWQEFERGTFAMYISGPWNVNEFRKRMSPGMQDKWNTAPWPTPEGEPPGASIAGGCSLVVFRRSQQQAAAWKFVEFLSTTDSQVEMCRCTSNLPARRDAWSKSGLANDPQYAAFHEQLKNVRPAPPVPEWEEIVTGELVKTAESVINGKATLEQGLRQLDRRVNQILEKRRWMLAQRAKQAS